MRVTFITHYTELYGANRSLLNLIDGLTPHGVSARVVCPDRGDLLPALAARGVPAAVVPFAWSVSAKRTAAGVAERVRHNLRLLRSLTAQLTAWGTDVVYTNASVMAVGAMAAAELEVPHVWHVREFGDRDYDLRQDSGGRLFRLALKSADACVFVSAALRRAKLGRSAAANSHVVYNGVASEAVFDERRRAAEALRDRRQPFTFVLVGRFRDGKGQAVAIEAFARLTARFPDAKLLLVGGAGGTGDQAYFEGCRASAARLGVADRVEFWGYVPDPERAFLVADVALMCSRNEAMGRVTAEAMSCGRPVIGYAGGGTPELIADGQTGRLYHGGPDALAAAMTAYAADPELATKHGDAAWHAAKARHTTEGYAAKILGILRGVWR